MPSALADALQVPRNGMTAHLKVLTDAGIVTATKSGRTVTYRLLDDTLAESAAFIEAIWKSELR